MGHFSNTFAALLRESGKNQSDIAAAVGCSSAQISRLISEDRPVSLDDLGKIALHVSDDPRDRARLVRAHLLDQCAGPGSELIDITIRGGQRVPALYDAPLAEPPLSPAMERALAVLRRHWKNPALKTILTGVADLLDDADVSSLLAASASALHDAPPAAKTPRRADAPLPKGRVVPASKKGRTSK